LDAYLSDEAPGSRSIRRGAASPPAAASASARGAVSLSPLRSALSSIRGEKLASVTVSPAAGGDPLPGIGTEGASGAHCEPDLRHVRFEGGAGVQVREFSRTMDWHPCVSSGVPLGLDWAFEDAASVGLDAYEARRSSEGRRGRQEYPGVGRLEPRARAALALGAGHALGDVEAMARRVELLRWGRGRGGGGAGASTGGDPADDPGGVSLADFGGAFSLPSWPSWRSWNLLAVG
jgi:hypothetical protein